MTNSLTNALSEIKKIVEGLELSEESDIIKPWFGGSLAPWAIRSDLIADHPDNVRYRQEFVQMCDGSINLNTHSWATAVYYFDDSTPRTDGLDIKNPGWGNLSAGTRLPWDPAWRHAEDDCSYTTLVGRGTGECFLIWQTRYNAASNIMACGAASVVKTGYKPGEGSAGSIWTKSNGFESSGAAGIALPHMLVTQQEIASELIPHCLRLGLPRPSRDTRFAPATKHIGVTGAPESGRLGTGVRIAFDGLTEIDVDQWSEEFPESVSRYMATIGRAVKDYGFLVVDNGGNETQKKGAVYFENNLSARWDQVGLTSDIMLSSLHSLLKPNLDKMRILAEPEFPGGDMNRTARYPGVDYPDDLI